MLLSNVAHMKEILIHLKPNNFPRYLDQLSELETAINAIDATKYSHASSAKVTVAEKEPDVMKEAVAITKEDIEKSEVNRRVSGDDVEKGSDDVEKESSEKESDGDGEKESSEKESNGDGEKEREETTTNNKNTEEKKETTQNANNPQEDDHPVVE